MNRVAILFSREGEGFLRKTNRMMLGGFWFGYNQ